MWPKKRASPAISDYDRFEVKKQRPGRPLLFYDSYEKKM
ncbi:hypothetical protein U471_10920 [Bacillus amyloliquefaciens CC178]|nr:hypothetical protein U471_10920 [Bacillus amyloliquefaciens CC178]